MIIKLPEWDGWRVAGSDTDWQIQEYVKDAKADGGHRWKGVNFFGSLEHAIGFAYERTLRERGEKVGEENAWLDECRRVKKSLLAAVKKVVA